MKNFHSFYLACFFESGNLLANVKSARISARGHDDADGSIARPAEVALADSSFDRGLQRLRQIAFHAHNDGLSFGIAEATIKFQYHRPTSRHHQAAVKHTLVLRSFGFHSCHYRARDVLHQPVAHLFIDNVLSRICAHASGVGPSIAIPDALVVLGSDQRRHALTIADHQE